MVFVCLSGGFREIGSKNPELLIEVGMFRGGRVRQQRHRGAFQRIEIIEKPQAFDERVFRDVLRHAQPEAAPVEARSFYFLGAHQRAHPKRAQIVELFDCPENISLRDSCLRIRSARCEDRRQNNQHSQSTFRDSLHHLFHLRIVVVVAFARN